MTLITGKLSIFGGISDKGMIDDTGLALYEPHEADLRPDLFLPFESNDKSFPTWKRLKEDALYCALRFDHSLGRKRLQETPVKIVNLITKRFVMAFLVDWGPHEKTNRIIDVSPGVADILEVKTDDEVKIIGLF